MMGKICAFCNFTVFKTRRKVAELLTFLESRIHVEAFFGPFLYFCQN